MPQDAAEPIRCVVFDAVGTLIHAEPSVAVAYQTISGRYGAELSVETIRRRFRQVMANRPVGSQTNEQVEREFWKSTVQQVIGQVNDPDACFENLYEHFAEPNHWRIADHCVETLSQLKRQGIDICIASNFDDRLRRVLQGKHDLECVKRTFISAEIGWRKPHEKFYQSLLQGLEIPASQILMVGDDFELDIVPARQLGIQALHLVPVAPTGVSDGTAISSLAQILPYCGIHDSKT